MGNKSAELIGILFADSRILNGDAVKKRDTKELATDRQIRTLSRAFTRQGIELRRERLSRGPAFRVKSGECNFTGRQHLFVDRRLPADQQLSLVIDYLLALGIALNEEELQCLPPRMRSLLTVGSSFSGDKLSGEKSGQASVESSQSNFPGA